MAEVDPGSKKKVLISVVIPAYNAEDFIERTLASALAQSHRNIEVIVVNDGSTDQTASIVKRLAAADKRIRLIQQENSGVAAARNAGIRASCGTYIAPLDADDLWHPSKLEKQLGVFSGKGSDLGLVYTLYRKIDADDLVISSLTRQRPEGWVFLQHLNQNFIGNGSSLLIRRKIIEEVGGYSSRLRHHGVEGCEDFFLQLNIAAKYRFGVVPEYLVGYRRTPGNMSRNWVRMLLSRRLVLLGFLERCSPAVKPDLQGAIQRNDFEIVRLGLKSGRYGIVAETCVRILTRSPTQFARISQGFWIIFVRKFKDRWNRTVSKRANLVPHRSYWDYPITETKDIQINPEFQAVTAELGNLDSKIGPDKGYLIRSPEKGNLGDTGTYQDSPARRELEA